MTRHELNLKYFKWLYQLVCNDRYSKRLSYKKLLTYLHKKEFSYIIDMDGNRADDGAELRYRFGKNNDLPEALIATGLDDRPCSVLEMMIALSIRCEEHIMDNPDIGNRTGQWFWNMIVNLGLGSMNDTKFNEEYTNDIIEKFLNREYKRNGDGGLFTITNCKHDLRTTEIWYQAMWYLDDILKG